MSVIDDLVALQEQDGVIRELEQTRKDIPARKEQEAARIASEKNALEGAEAAVQDIRLRISALEGEAQDHRAAVDKMKQQQMTLKTNKEFAAMNAQIRREEEIAGETETSALEARDLLEPAERHVQECKEKYDAAVADSAKYCEGLDERLKEVDEELAKAVAAREELRKPLDVPSFRRHLVYYERFSKKRWPALVRVNDGVCSGCLMNLPPSKVQSARRVGAEVVVCDYCGRMLYTD